MTNLRLLLVDDEEKFLDAVRPRLHRRGIDVLTAVNGLDALRLLDEHPIDVVVLDVRMPGLDGVEVLRKAKQKHPLLEVIMLTGHASVESAVEGLKLGAFDYVTKPYDLSDLMEKVNQAYTKKLTMEEKIRKAKVEKIVSHPMAVFEREEEE